MSPSLWLMWTICHFPILWFCVLYAHNHFGSLPVISLFTETPRWMAQVHFPQNISSISLLAPRTSASTLLVREPCPHSLP